MKFISIVAVLAVLAHQPTDAADLTRRLRRVKEHKNEGKRGYIHHTNNLRIGRELQDAEGSMVAHIESTATAATKAAKEPSRRRRGLQQSESMEFVVEETTTTVATKASKQSSRRRRALQNASMSIAIDASGTPSTAAPGTKAGKPEAADPHSNDIVGILRADFFSMDQIVSEETGEPIKGAKARKLKGTDAENRRRLTEEVTFGRRVMKEEAIKEEVASSFSMQQVAESTGKARKLHRIMKEQEETGSFSMHPIAESKPGTKARKLKGIGVEKRRRLTEDTTFGRRVMKEEAIKEEVASSFSMQQIAESTGKARKLNRIMKEQEETGSFSMQQEAVKPSGGKARKLNQIDVKKRRQL